LDSRSEVLPIAGGLARAMICAFDSYQQMNKLHGKFKTGATKKCCAMTRAGGTLTPGVGAVERSRARGAAWREITVADQTFAFRNPDSYMCRLDLLPGPVATPYLSRKQSQPADASGQLPSWVGYVAGRFRKSPPSFRVHWDPEHPSGKTAPPRCCLHLAGSAFLRLTCRQDAGSTLRFMERRRGRLAEHDHEPSPGSLTYSLSRIRRKKVAEGQARVQSMRRRLDAAEGASPVRHRKLKRQLRRRNTRPAPGRLRRLNQTQNTRRRTPAGKLFADEPQPTLTEYGPN
jgi:hypothetical protein